MKLQTRILLACGFFRYGGTALLMLFGYVYHPLYYFLSAAWLICCRPALRHLLIPPLFPKTTCPNAGCRKRIELRAIWKCGSHYIDFKPRHVCAFHCNAGHELRSFGCPHCRTTIQVQKALKAKLTHGEQIEESVAGPPLARSPLAVRLLRSRPKQQGLT